MASSPLKWDFILGSIFLDQFECPEEFEIGWEKNLAEHRYLAIDGSYKINTHVMGVYPVPTKWTGTLFYQTALLRFQQLEALATQLTPVVWQYGPLQYLVDVKSVIGKVKYQFEIDYEIDIVVIQSVNQTVPFSDLQVGGSVSAQTFYDDGNTDYASFQGEVQLTPPTAMQTLYTGMIDAITGQTPLSAATIQGLLVVSASIGAFLTESFQFLNILKATPLTEIGTNQLAFGMQMAANFGQFKGFVDALVGTTPSSTVISAPSGASLYTLSGQFYPQLPPDQGATMIAQANGLFDMFLPADSTLAIPPLHSA